MFIQIKCSKIQIPKNLEIYLKKQYNNTKSILIDFSDRYIFIKIFLFTDEKICPNPPQVSIRFCFQQHEDQPLQS